MPVVILWFLYYIPHFFSLVRRVFLIWINHLKRGTSTRLWLWSWWSWCWTNCESLSCWIGQCVSDCIPGFNAGQSRASLLLVTVASHHPHIRASLLLATMQTYSSGQKCHIISDILTCSYIGLHWQWVNWQHQCPWEEHRSPVMEVHRTIKLDDILHNWKNFMDL